VLPSGCVRFTQICVTSTQTLPEVPCKRCRGPLQLFRAFATKDLGGGQWGPPYAIVERRKCERCRTYFVRWIRGTLKPTPEAALRAYGCTEDEISDHVERYHREKTTEVKPAERRRKEKPPIEAPLTSWPFPTSASTAMFQAADVSIR
jgi:hypothetical protein